MKFPYITQLTAQKGAMSGVCIRYVPLFLALFAILGTCPVLGQQSFPPNTNPRLRTICDTILWLVPKREKFEYIRAGTMVVPSMERRVDDQTYFWVTVPAISGLLGDPIVGWIRADDLKRLESKAEIENRRRTEAEAERTEIEMRENLSLPLSQIAVLSRIANRENVDEADRELLIGVLESITKLFQESKQMPNGGIVSPPLPEPYFALAELLAKFGNHGESLQNYLEGLRCVKSDDTRRDNTYSIVLYEQYFPKIDMAVENALIQPASVANLGREERITAGRQFSQGFGNFWDGEYERDDVRRNENYRRALYHFDNAIMIVWQEPAYWYYRGLAHWRLGDREKATFNFLFGSQLEKRLKNHRTTSEFLTRFQGKDRVLLEQIRWGDPSGLILEDFLK